MLVEPWHLRIGDTGIRVEEEAELAKLTRAELRDFAADLVAAAPRPMLVVVRGGCADMGEELSRIASWPLELHLVTGAADVAELVGGVAAAAESVVGAAPR